MPEASFTPIFHFLWSSILHLRSGMGQTDRWTDRQRHQCIMPPPSGVRGTTTNSTMPDKPRDAMRNTRSSQTLHTAAPVFPNCLLYGIKNGNFCYFDTRVWQTDTGLPANHLICNYNVTAVNLAVSQTAYRKMLPMQIGYTFTIIANSQLAVCSDSWPLLLNYILHLHSTCHLSSRIYLPFSVIPHYQYLRSDQY